MDEDGHGERIATYLTIARRYTRVVLFFPLLLFSSVCIYHARREHWACCLAHQHCFECVSMSKYIYLLAGIFPKEDICIYFAARGET